MQQQLRQRIALHDGQAMVAGKQACVVAQFARPRRYSPAVTSRFASLHGVPQRLHAVVEPSSADALAS